MFLAPPDNAIFKRCLGKDCPRRRQRQRQRQDCTLAQAKQRLTFKHFLPQSETHLTADFSSSQWVTYSAVKSRKQQWSCTASV